MGTEPLNTPAVPPPAQDPATEYARTLEALTPGVWLVPGVLAVNVLVFVIMAASGVSPMEPTVDGLIHWGANFGPLTTGGQWWRLLTSMFVHIGLFHIGMNMFVLWDIGRFMERLLGRGGFLVMYLFAGLAGSLASLAWNPFVVSAGASGAIFGLYGGLFAYLARFRHAIPAQSLAGLQKGAVTFIGYNVVYGFLIQGIDISAHIGGLAGGFAIGLLLCHPPTAQAAGRRTALALRAAILGCAAVVAVALVLPRTPDLDALAKGFGAVERQVIDATNTAVAEWRAAKLDDEAFANRLEKDVLSPWRAARESIAKLRGLPKLQQAFVTDLLRFADQRTAAWELLATGARAHDGEKVKQAWEILAPTPVTRSGSDGGRVAEAFPACGNIDPASFPQLLVGLYRHGATGSLKVTGPAHSKALYFRESRILFGSSNDPRDQLGAILIESGRISRGQLDEVNAKVSPGNRLPRCSRRAAWSPSASLATRRGRRSSATWPTCCRRRTAPSSSRTASSPTGRSTSSCPPSGSCWRPSSGSRTVRSCCATSRWGRSLNRIPKARRPSPRCGPTSGPSSSGSTAIAASRTPSASPASTSSRPPRPPARCCSWVSCERRPLP